MDFKSSYRMEAVYFQKLKSDIDIVKSLMNDGNTEEARALLENAVDVDGAVLLLYRNLGDIWGELGAQIQKTNEALKELKETTDKYHEELNEKIDDVNNTIIRLLNALEDRIAAVERDLASMSRVKILSLVNENGTYHIYDGETEIDFAALSNMVEFPHDVIVRGVVNGEETVFQLRELDTDTAGGSFEFYSTGLDNNVVNEITVTVLPDDSVNVATDIQTMKEYTAGNGINISLDDEISVDTDVIQEKLTAGPGISIDPDTNEIENTSPGKIYTAGSGISIDPVTNEISNTAQGVNYTAGFGIGIDSGNAIFNRGGFPRIDSNGMSNFISGAQLTNLNQHTTTITPDSNTKCLPVKLYQNFLNVNLKHDIVKAELALPIDLTIKTNDGTATALFICKVIDSSNGLTFSENSFILFMNSSGVDNGYGGELKCNMFMDCMGYSKKATGSVLHELQLDINGVLFNDTSESMTDIKGKFLTYLRKQFLRFYYGTYAAS